MKNKILIIEDDPAIQLGLKDSLEEENYFIETSSNGSEGYSKAYSGNFDLILLDLMLPQKNGYDVARDLRKNQIPTPIIMLTSKKEEIDKVLGFEIGADDYITKPFSINELKMRIKAVLRRTHIESAEEVKVNQFEFGDIKVNYSEQTVTKSGKPIELTVKEISILKYLFDNSGKVVSREDLLDRVWQYDSYPSSRTVDNYILSLRKKIEDDPSNPKHILTIHTAGYKFLR